MLFGAVSFHQAACDCFTNNPRFTNIFISVYSPFLNPIKELLMVFFFVLFFWHGGGRSVSETPTSAFLDITVEACQGWIRYARSPLVWLGLILPVILIRISGLTQTRFTMLWQNKCDFFLYVNIGNYMELILLYSTFFINGIFLQYVYFFT